jgi:TatA/E family protein of Tat protein translocase
MSIFSPIHIVFFAVIALLALGPKRFPEFARALGHGVREFRDVFNGDVSRRRKVGGGGKTGKAAPAGEAASAGEAMPAAGETTAASAADTSSSGAR